MLQIERVRARVRTQPTSDPSVAIFRELLAALDSGGKLTVSSLYELDYPDFQMCIKAIEEWRLHRHWAKAA